jgi:peptidoglycan-N-acetylglucosamine deacetylase
MVPWQVRKVLARVAAQAGLRRGRGLVVPMVLVVLATALGVGIAACGDRQQQRRESAAAAAAAAALVQNKPKPPSKYVLLTFDDGPDPNYTPQILAILKQYGAKATFFEVGRNVERHPELTKRIHAEGHSVQNHTWSHLDLKTASWPVFRQQVADTDRVIQAQTGSVPRCLRPPYGAVDKVVDQRIAALGKQPRLWTIDSRDWAKPGPSMIVKRVLSSAENGSVILMHDGGGNRTETIAALPTILKTLKAKGYAFYPTYCT